MLARDLMRRPRIITGLERESLVRRHADYAILSSAAVAVKFADAVNRQSERDPAREWRDESNRRFWLRPPRLEDTDNVARILVRR